MSHLKHAGHIGRYYLFFTVIKQDYIGFGIEIPKEPYKSEHFCTRDINFHFWHWYFTFWIEDTSA